MDIYGHRHTHCTLSLLALLPPSLPPSLSLPIGPSSPHSPVNTTATSIRYNGAVINWIVTSIAYTPEQYTVLYGTSSNNLSQSSLVLNGSANFSITDAVLSLDLIDLMHDTVYYYRVRSTNTEGATESDINNFRTREKRKYTCNINVHIHYKRDRSKATNLHAYTSASTYHRPALKQLQ